MFSTSKEMFTLPSGAAAPPVFDAISAAQTFTSYSFTAASGADVFLLITCGQGITVSGATYGGASMTPIASFSLPGGQFGIAVVNLFKLAGAGTGFAKTMAFSFSGGFAPNYLSRAFSYAGVTSTDATSTQTGSGTTASQSVSPASNQLAVECLLGSGNSAASVGVWSPISGGTVRANSANNYNVLGIVETGSPAAVSATDSTIAYWGTIRLILTGI